VKLRKFGEYLQGFSSPAHISLSNSDGNMPLPKIGEPPRRACSDSPRGGKEALTTFLSCFGGERDIIIDSNLKPMLLELNDRPSLGVLMFFVKDLKTDILREIFYQVTTDGSTLSENENSGWQQIMRVADSSPLRGPIQTVMAVSGKLKHLGTA
jgi:hypothetical protein